MYHKLRKINYVNLIVYEDGKEEKDIEQWKDVIDYFSNIDKQLNFCFLGKSVYYSGLEELLNHICFRGHDFTIWCPSYSEIDIINKISLFVPVLMINCKDNMGSQYIGRARDIVDYGNIIKIMTYKDSGNVGDLVFNFKISKNNADVILNSVKILSQLGMYSNIDFSTAKSNSQYQNYNIDSITADIKRTDSIVMVLDKMLREKYLIYNKKYIQYIIDRFPDKFNCGILNDLFCYTVDSQLKMNLCPLIKGLSCTQIDYNNISKENSNVKDSIQLDHSKYCRGCCSCICVEQFLKFNNLI